MTLNRACLSGLLASRLVIGAGRTSLSTASNSAKASPRWLAMGVGAATAGGLALIFALEKSVNASDVTLHPLALPWSHSGTFATLDMASVRRGYQVYKQVCAACHSMEQLAYRHFIGAFMTEEEARREAAEVMVQDGPDDTGKMFTRPGKLADYLPKPYPNENAARAANNGALPPDLSWIVLARHGCEDYIFSLLTGYVDAPAGVKLGNGQAYNPYFLGGGLSMAQQLYDEGLTYDDGTPATMSQQAKDVSTFLRWASEPFHDTRKYYALKLGLLLPIISVVLLYWKRHAWTFLKSQKWAFRPVKGREPPSH